MKLVDVRVTLESYRAWVAKRESLPRLTRWDSSPPAAGPEVELAFDWSDRGNWLLPAECEDMTRDAVQRAGMHVLAVRSRGWRP